MRVTREEIRAAFEEVLRTGACVEIGTESGLFFQKGAELNAGTPDEEKKSGSWAGPYDDEGVYLTTDDGAEPVHILCVDDAVEEFDLSRRHVMSPLGRSQTAKRWYEGPRGPKSLSTKTAGGHTCATCGFFVPLKGELNLLFGVCANKWSPDDGRVVSLDHGCGEHSEIEPPEPTHLWVQSKPAFDDLHIDIIAHAPREESPEVELIERINDRDEDEATDEDIDANVTAEDDLDETEETGAPAEQPQVEETIDLSGDVVPSAEHADDESDGSDAERSETESADARDAAGESGSQTDTSVRVEPEPESESDDSADPDDSTAQNA